MKHTASLLFLAALLMVSGCGSSISVNHDFDVNANFEAYRTYKWIPQPKVEPGDARTAQQSNDLLDKRIRTAIEDALLDKGLAPNPGAPDLMVVYHVGVQEKVQVTDWGYRYSDSYWGWGGRDIDVYNYKEGTLIIDLIDSRTEQLVWRGAGKKALDDGKVSPEKQEDIIRRVVAKIMSKYPPKR